MVAACPREREGGGTAVATVLRVFERPTHEDPRTGARVTARGDAWTVESRTLHADCKAVRLSGISPANDGAARTLLLPFDRIVPLASRREPRILRPRTWNRLVLTAVARNRPFGSLGTAASARIQILPFQLEPALAMLRHGQTRVLVADEVGLGKTIQAGLVIAELSAGNDAFRGIVLAPASLTDQWVREVRERFALIAKKTDAGWLASHTRQLPPDVNPWSLPGIYVASLDFVKRPEVLRALEDVTWDVIVMDEAHAAGVGTARLAAAHAIATRSRRVLLLTATPPDGDPRQLAALMEIGDTGDPIVQFRRSRADVGQPSRRRTVLLQVRLSPAERRMHRLLERYTAMVWTEAGRFDSRARLAATLLRKRALSSASSLAASVQRRSALLAGASPNEERQLALPLGDEDPLDDAVIDGVLGAPGLGDAARERALLARIEKHAIVASRCESKIGVLVRLIRRVRQPAIVFTEYRDTLFHLALALRAAGHDPLLLHGGLLARERAESLRVFEERDSLLLATDAASEGLNLHQRCRLVVHFELPWTLSRIEQRTGRVDRLGQTRGVHEVLLVARDTAERVVLIPLVRRARLAVDGGVRGTGALLAITESSVAAAIIGGEPIGPPAHGSGWSASYWRLTQEGDDEARRIEIERRADARFRLRASDDAVLITALRRRSPPRLTLVLQILLSHRAGRPVHSELVVLQTDIRWDGDRRARRLRRFVASLVDECWDSLVAAVECSAAVSVERAAHHHTVVITRLQQRDHAMLKTLPSAARRLVQAGLFDSRALKALERERRAAAQIVGDVDERADVAASSLRLERIVRLAGVRVGSA